MSDSPIRVLLVDDEQISSELTQAMLTNIGQGRFDLEWVSDYQAGLKALAEGRCDICLLDYRLADHVGTDLLREARAAGCQTPVVMLTGFEDRDADLEAMEAGASDYLIKDRLEPALLERSIRYSIQQARALAALRESERQQALMLARLEKSHEDLQAILDQLRLGVAMTDEEGRIVFLNEEGQRLFERGADELHGKPWHELAQFRAQVRQALESAEEAPAGRRERVPVSVEVPSGLHRWMDVEIRDDPRDARRKILFFYDTSEIHDLRLLLEQKAEFHDLVGKSSPMLSVYQQIRDLAAVDTTVLIEGETGTGKELVARALHACSHRKNKPFLAVNCAGLTESLLGSQLFGHRRGAFTGAVEDHEGVFEAAAGGTIFLDEVGDVPMAVQVSLLRVLQEREITRLGESKPRRIDVRVLAATNRDLATLVAQGQVRQDLFYRIRVATISLPPLRERREDIPLLAATFLARSNASTSRSVQVIEPAAMRRLVGYPWPGNVRELQTAIEVAVIRCKGDAIRAADLPPDLAAVEPAVFEPSEESGDEAERIREALRRARGNRTRAAQLLGMSRATLYRRLSELGLQDV